MRRHPALLLSATAALLVGATLLPLGGGADASVKPTRGVMEACPDTTANQGQCQALIVTTKVGSAVPLATATYQNGLTPADIQDAYHLPADGGDGRTVAVIESKNYPNLESDLSAYRSQFGLSPCTTTNGCLTIVNQNGGSKLPGQGIGIGWFVETALDVDSVSSACPACHILVVQANSSSKKDLAIGNATAASMGAVAVSNSWKTPEFVHEATGSYASYFDHPGVAFLASSGDGGSGKGRTIGYPAGLPTVVAVGGTSLVADDSTRGWTESAWAGAGSACGQYVAKPAWQTDPGCPMRTTSDVSAVADPHTGLAVYVTDTKGGLGWLVVGGTSLSSPLIAGVYGQAGNTTALGSDVSAYLYAHADQLYDVTTGSNGTGCAITYICNAGPGYDGPTGLGTPNGLGAF